jgi:chemotaxis regulatin CheY-phosphate phosphatase CheZ
MVGIFGDERLSKDTEELLEQWDQLEAGQIDVDKFKETVEKQSEKMIVKRDTESS